MPQPFEIQIETNMAYVQKNLPKDLHSVIQPAYTSAMSRALTSAKTETYRRLAKVMGITQKNLKNQSRETVAIKRPGKGSMDAWLAVRGVPTAGANSLQANPRTRSKSGRGHLKGGGVSYKAWGVRQKAPKAFIMPATGGANQPGTKGDQKYFIAIRHSTGKITAIFGPWAPREYSSKRGKKQGPGVDFYTTRKLGQVFVTRYTHEVNRRLTRILNKPGYLKTKGVKQYFQS